jgi:hypothetical protein
MRIPTAKDRGCDQRPELTSIADLDVLVVCNKYPFLAQLRNGYFEIIDVLPFVLIGSNVRKLNSSGQSSSRGAS